VHDAYLFVLSIDEQAGLEPEAAAVVVAEAVVRSGVKFSQCSVVWGGLPLADALFLLDGGRRKERKKKSHGGGGFHLQTHKSVENNVENSVSSAFSLLMINICHFCFIFPITTHQLDFSSFRAWT
jgi:hypothetical protein